jgi:signal transduction histidine kinase
MIRETPIAIVLAVALLLLSFAEVFGTPPAHANLTKPGVLAVAFVVLLTVPVAFQPRWPLPALAVTGAALIALQAFHYVVPPVHNGDTVLGPVIVAGVVAIYLTASRADRTTAGRVLVVALIATTAAELAIAGTSRIGAATVMGVAVLVGWTMGTVVGTRRQHEAELVAAENREREANARAAVVEERARIAREMHDIVAHKVSLMVVQTMAADRVQDGDPARAHELHATVEASGREAVAELRTMLGLLRAQDGETSTSRGPQPSLDELPALIDSVRRAGLHVEITETGERHRLGATTDLTAYRLVQEGLTNTLKHAGPTDAQVDLAWTSSDLTLTIRDQGARDGISPDVQPVESGHGLIGMRERVHACGGQLTVGPLARGGFQIQAHLPVSAERQSVYGPDAPDELATT